MFSNLSHRINVRRTLGERTIEQKMYSKTIIIFMKKKTLGQPYKPSYNVLITKKGCSGYRKLLMGWLRNVGKKM